MNVKEIKDWAKMEVNGAERRLQEQAEYVARDLEDQAQQIRQGRIYSTDCQNMVGKLNTLHDLKKELEMLQQKVQMLEEIKEE